MSAVKLGGDKLLASTVVTIQKDGSSSEFVIAIPNFTVGRSVTCDIKINELVVSRIHLAVEIKFSRVFITDKNSSLGTFVNDIRIAPMTETEVKPSDQVKLGDSVLFFKLNGGAFEPAVDSGSDVSSDTGSFHPVVPTLETPQFSPLKVLPGDGVAVDGGNEVRAQAILADATIQSTTIISNAEKQATSILSGAEKNSRRITDAAYEKAEKILAETNLETKKLLEKARDEAVLLKTNQVQTNERLFKETMDRANQLQEKFAAEGQRLRAQSQAEADLLISRARDEAARVREHTTKEMALLKSQVSADADFLIEEGERARTQGHEEARRQLAKAREDIDLAHEQAIKDTEFLRVQVLSETKRAQALAEAAETEARTMIEQARIESGNLKNQALQESQRRIQQATDQANELHAKVLAEIEELRSEAKQETTTQLAEAKKEANRLKAEAQEETDRLRKLVKSESELAHKHAIEAAHEKANRGLADVFAKTEEQKLHLTKMRDNLSEQIQSRTIELDALIQSRAVELEKIKFDSNAQEQFLKHTLAQIEDAKTQSNKWVAAKDLALRKHTEVKEELSKIEEKHSVLSRGIVELELRKKTIQDEISVETKKAKDKIQDAVRDFQKQRDEKIHALIEENDKEAARLKAELLKAVQDQRFRMAQVIHQRLWKRLLQTIPEDQFEKLDEASLDEIMEGIQEHLASYSTEPGANLVSQKTAMQRQQRRNTRWMTLGLVIGLGIGGAAYTVQERLRAADLNAVLAKEQSQRSQELAARKYQPPQDSHIREAYADSVIFTQGFVEIYSDDEIQGRWVKEATQYMYKQWKVDEEKTVEAISMLRTLVQVLESQRQKIHPDFVPQGRKKMDEHEQQTIAKVKEILGTNVKFEAYKRLEIKFMSDELNKRAAPGAPAVSD